ncbi:MAG TPA: FixH family protein [Cellvibrio sp.]|nr:FixH family protein [Cellvibrio sp.]
MTDQLAEKKIPGYRQFWFWFVFGPLLFIIVLCGILVFVAFKNSDDVVTDNYYKVGRMINQTLAQDEKAVELGLLAKIKIDQLTGDVLVSLTGNHSFPKQMLLFLDNPAKANKDQRILLTELAAGEYRGELSAPIEYSWYISLVPESDASRRKEAEWLLTGQIDLAKTTETSLQSRAQPSSQSLPAK